MNVLNKIEAEQLKKDIAAFNVGDTIKVHTRVIEGDKERIQIYAGIVIGRNKHGGPGPRRQDHRPRQQEEEAARACG